MNDQVRKAEVIEALEAIERTSADNIERSHQIQSRVRQLRRGLLDGAPLALLLEKQPRPLTVELVTQNLQVLQDIGSRLRYAQAQALRAEGLTVQEIADLFGVTRQRISALLRQRGNQTSQDGP